MKRQSLISFSFLMVASSIFASFHSDLIENRDGYTSVKIFDSKSDEPDFFLSCFSFEGSADLGLPGYVESSVQCVFASDSQKLKIIPFSNRLVVKKNNNGEHQMVASGRFTSFSKALHLSLHHLVQNKNSDKTTGDALINITTIFVLSKNPDERLVSYLSSKPIVYQSSEFFQITEDYGAFILTINEYQTMAVKKE